MIYSVAGAYTNDTTIGDGADINAAGVMLTNSALGRIVGGVHFLQGGSTVINEEGGIVRVADGVEPYYNAAVTGSAGDDTFVNYGLVSGLVQMGDGNDSYTKGGVAQTSDNVDLGAGDDVLVRTGTSGWLAGVGGTGTDRLVMNIDNQGAVYGSNFSGFEILELNGTGQFVDFSGYSSIVLGAPAGYGQALITSLNPTVDLALAGNDFRLANSTLHSITGTSDSEFVELGGSATAVAGAVSLGGGDDGLSLTHFGTDGQTALPGGGADGGAGQDLLALMSYSAGSFTYDLTTVTGFERLNLNVGNVQTVSYDLTNVDGYTAIDIGQQGSLILRDSQSPTANLSGGLGGTIVLETGSTVGRYGFPLNGFWNQSVDIVQGDDTLSVDFVNHGQVLGEMRFYIGDDYYDGTAGSVSGTVYGNAGNDLLVGNIAAETFEGGYGFDQLYGNGGNDILKGDAGNDTLVGGTGNDSMYGGLGNDVFYVDAAGDLVVETGGQGTDRVVASVSYALGASSDVETLETTTYAGTGAIDLTGNSLGNTIYGNNGANALNGQGGADSLHGFAGNDYLYGASELDNLYGGAGDDAYYIAFDDGDRVWEFAGEGYDVVSTEVNYTLPDVAYVERLEAGTLGATTALYLGGSYFDNLIIGNAGNNTLRGFLGNDTLQGLGGDDYLIGDEGADVMYGGTGNDTYYVGTSDDRIFENAGEGSADRVATEVSFTLPTEAEVEILEAVNLTGTAIGELGGSQYANAITGDAGNNVLRGYAGDDVLNGYSGDDVLIGDEGDDLMTGGAGRDVYFVDSAGDVVVETGQSILDRVATSVSYALAADSWIYYFETTSIAGTSAIDLTGSSLRNVLIGNDGANTLDGKGDNDILSGNGGADIFAFTTVAGSGNIDAITDFAAGTDKIALDDAVFAALAPGGLASNAYHIGASAGDADDRIIYDSAVGALYYDADGTGAGAQVQFASLGTGLAVSASDFLVI